MAGKDSKPRECIGIDTNRSGQESLASPKVDANTLDPADAEPRQRKSNANARKANTNEPEQSPSLYEILGLVSNNEVEITMAEIKKAYRKRALELHPDKVQGGANDKEIAKAKFQVLQHAHDILSNPERRKLYDQFGIHCNLFESRESFDEFDVLLQRFAMFIRPKEVAPQDICDFLGTYRESQAEREDVVRAFEAGKNVFAFIMGARPDDVNRYICWLKAEVEAGRKQCDFFTEAHERKLKTQAENLRKKEKREEKLVLSEAGQDNRNSSNNKTKRKNDCVSDSDLAAIIAARQSQRTGALAHICPNGALAQAMREDAALESRQGGKTKTRRA